MSLDVLFCLSDLFAQEINRIPASDRFNRRGVERVEVCLLANMPRALFVEDIHAQLHRRKRYRCMNYSVGTILAAIAILFVLLTYITTAPLVPVAVILLALAIILGGRGGVRPI